MKLALAIFVAVVFLAIVVAGPMVSMYPGNHGLGHCLASLVERADCPPNSNILGLVSFHFGAVQSFLKAFVSSSSQLALLAAALFCFSLIFSISVLNVFLKTVFTRAFYYRKRLESVIGKADRKFSDWLKILGRSPTFC